jgi:hypothetical protein
MYSIRLAGRDHLGIAVQVWGRLAAGLDRGQVGELAGDLLAVWLVIAADLPDGSADAFAGMRAPCPELLVGGGCRWRLGVEDVLRVLLEQRIGRRAGAEVAGFGRSGSPGQDVDLVEVEQALCARRRDDAAFQVPVGPFQSDESSGPMGACLVTFGQGTFGATS